MDTDRLARARLSYLDALNQMRDKRVELSLAEENVRAQRAEYDRAYVAEQRTREVRER